MMITKLENQNQQQRQENKALSKRGEKGNQQQRHKANLMKKLYGRLGNETPKKKMDKRTKQFKDKLKSGKSKIYEIVAWFWKIINVDGKEFGFRSDFYKDSTFTHHRSVVYDWIKELEEWKLVKITYLTNDMKLTPTKKFLELLNDVETMEIIERRTK